MKTLYPIIAVVIAAAVVASAQAQSGIARPVPEPETAPRASRAPTTAPAAPRSVSSGVYAQNGAADFGGGYGFSRSSGSSVPPVVIQFGGRDSAAIAAMEEDLAVMTHIIDRALERMGENEPDEKMGIKLYYTSGGKSVRALYLDNFGPLFLVKVNFPVHAPGSTEAKPAEQEEDSEWNRARRALYGQPEDARWQGVSSGVPYQAERVESLKKQLAAALKNASNMKQVKPDEHITITVFGSPALVNGDASSRGGAGFMRGVTPSPNANGNADHRRDPAAALAETSAKLKSAQNLDNVRTALQGTVLTLRVKKSDLNTDDEDALLKKVTINTYAGNGHGLSSVNSWIRSSSSSTLRVR